LEAWHGHTSTERYDRIGAAMRWSQILASASAIFFGFLLNITVDRPSNFSYYDNVNLVAALYAVTVATTMFLTPVIYHPRHYRKLDVDPPTINGPTQSSYLRSYGL
jgi:hypothetical protein